MNFKSLCLQCWICFSIWSKNSNCRKKSVLKKRKKTTTPNPAQASLNYLHRATVQTPIDYVPNGNIPEHFIMHSHNFLAANKGCLILLRQNYFVDGHNRSHNPVSTVLVVWLFWSRVASRYNCWLPYLLLLKPLTKRSLWTHLRGANHNPHSLKKAKPYCRPHWAEPIWMSFHILVLKWSKISAEELSKTSSSSSLCDNLGIFSLRCTGLDKAPVTGPGTHFAVVYNQ